MRWIGVIVGVVIGLAAILFLFGDQLFRSFGEGSFASDPRLAAVELERVDSELLLSQIQSDPSKVKLLNVWATWCKPCVEEMPYILQTYRENKDKGMSLYLVSADVSSATERAKEMLLEFGVDFKTYQKDYSDGEFIERLSPDWTGALPATFIYNETGELIDFWMGDASLEDFRAAVSDAFDQ